MKKRVLQALVVSVCASFLGGCGTVSKEQRTLLEERVRTFSVQSMDSAQNTPVTNADIANALVRSMYDASGIRRVYSFFNNGRYTQGLSIEIDSALNITAFYRDDYETLKKHKAGTFRVLTTNEGPLTKVQVTCPGRVEDYDSYKVGVLSKNLFSDNQVATDLSRLCDGLNIAITRTKYVRAELNTQFPSDSVFANFSRKLKPLQDPEKVKSYDIEKAKLFGLSQGNTNFDVAVSVFPYRTGSKVVYGFRYPYTLRGDGTSTFKTVDVQEVEKKLVAVAND